MARPEKSQAVEEISERFREASAALLTEYRGLHVGEIAEVRGALREAQTEYKVLKNTLARIAVREVGLEELVGMLEGPTAIAFVKGDAVEAAKALDDAAKKFPVLVIKGGVIEGKIIDADQARALAKLEPRETQLTKIVLMVNQPLQQTANVLSALLRDFGSMLAQVVAQKESEAPAAEAPAPEAPAAEVPAPEAPAEEAPASAESEEASEVGGGLAEEPSAEADDSGAEQSGDDEGSGAPAAEGGPEPATAEAEAEPVAEAAPAETPPAEEQTEEDATEDSSDSEEGKE